MAAMYQTTRRGLFAILVCVVIFVVLYIGGKPKLPVPASGKSALHGQLFHGIKTPKYTGWELADDKVGKIAPHKARVVFYIMVASWKEMANLDAIMGALYHVDHMFLIHMDVKAEPKARQALERRIAQTLEQRGRGVENIQLVEPAMPITWGGFTMTLNVVYGITKALHWTSNWDYFINLSASDLPLISTDEVAGILGEHKGTNTSFIKGFIYQPAWEGYKFVDRREMFAEDRVLLRDHEPERIWPWAILDAEKNMLTRPLPNLFTVYKGEFWVTLHRSMAEYIHKSPDNQARMLLAYFSGMMVSDEEFFQTVACNPHFPSDTIHVHNDNLRFVNWWGEGASPAVVTPPRAVAAANSGAMFARKFSSTSEEGKQGVEWVQKYLRDGLRKEARVARVKRRISSSMGPEGKPRGFCGLKPEKNPVEANFALPGDEEKLDGRSYAAWLGDRRRTLESEKGGEGFDLEQFA